MGLSRFSSVASLRESVILELGDLTRKTDNIFLQLFRYACVGGFAFIFDFGALVVFTELLHVYYLLSVVIAYILALAITYTLSISWIFSRRSVSNKWLESGTFALITLIGLGVLTGSMWVFTEELGVYYLASKIVSTAFVFMWNFSVKKVILFK